MYIQSNIALPYFLKYKSLFPFELISSKLRQSKYEGILKNIDID
jgi:hypothetical protein